MEKIAQQLSAIMQDVGAISKRGKNAQQGFEYRKIEDIINELHGIFAQHKVLIIPEVVEERSEDRTTSRGANLIYRILKVKITYLSGDDGSSRSVIVVGEGMDSGDKASNKAMTAALKYALSQTFLLPYEMVDAEKQSHETIKKEEGEKTNAVIAPDQKAFNSKLYDAMALCAITTEELQQYLLGKGFITGRQTIDNLPEKFVNTMLQDENWQKVVKAITEGRKS